MLASAPVPAPAPPPQPAPARSAVEPQPAAAQFAWLPASPGGSALIAQPSLSVAPLAAHAAPGNAPASGIASGAETPSQRTAALPISATRSSLIPSAAAASPPLPHAGVAAFDSVAQSPGTAWNAQSSGSEPVNTLHRDAHASLEAGVNASLDAKPGVDFAPPSAEIAAAEKSGSAASGSIGDRAAPAALRAAHASGAAESSVSPAQMIAVPPPTAQSEIAAYAHNSAAAPLPGSAHAAMNSAMNSSMNSSMSSSMNSSAQEPFAALDAESGPGIPAFATWTRTGAHSLEAGFEDPALGWVGVRADLNAGAIHAALVPGSAEAAQALGSQISSLHAYLSEQRTPLGSLTLAAPESGFAFSGADPGAASSQQNAPQQDAAPAPAPAISSAMSGARSGNATQAIDSEPRAPLFEHSGAYISVLA